MKKCTFLLALLAISMMMTAQLHGNWSAKQAFKPSEKSVIASMLTATAAPESTVVLEEDFSLFTAGTEDQPDSKNIAPGTNYVYEVDPAYTHVPHWLGYSVYQAGGCAAIAMYDYYGYMYGGYISTPEAELYGEATITFRARRATANPTVGTLDLALCDNTSGRLETKEFPLTSEWQEFTWTTDKATFNDKNIFQFTTVGGMILVDDIKITRVRNKIANVDANNPINNSPTEFVASWMRSTTADIDGYLFSLWRTEMPEKEETGSVSIDFESINVLSDGKSIDTDNPGYPEGWTIDVSTNGEQDMCTTKGDYNSGKQGINFDAEGDYILSPEMPAPISKISFWVKPSSMKSEEYYFSLVGVQVKDIYGEWEPIAALPNYWMNSKGGMYVFEGDEVGHYITQVRFSCEGSYGITFAIDDITLEYATQAMPKMLITDSLVTDTFCLVSGIDPSMEHFYNVKVKEGDLISAPSNSVWVDGITGITPVALPATDITENSFVANWEGNHNAGSYKLTISQTEKTTTANQEVVMIEEDFSGIKDGTFTDPGFSWDLIHNLSEHGQSTQEWLLTYPRWVVGMAGSQGPNEWSGRAGLVLSPKMKLGNNAVKVSFKAYNKLAGERIWVLAVEEHDSPQAVAGVVVPCGKANTYTTDTVILDNVDFGEKPLHIAFMSEQGEFYIDDVKISLIVPEAGTIIEKVYKTLEVKETSCAITDLPAGTTEYAYNVIVKRTKDFLDYTSNISNTVLVNLLSTDVEDVQVPDTEEAIKVISNGQMLILREGKTYNVMGVQIK